MSNKYTGKVHIGIMFNEDPNHHFGESAAVGGPNFCFTPETEQRFIDQYKGTQLTDFLINVNFMRSVYPSKVRESYCDIINPPGKPNEYYNAFVRDKFDVFQYWIDGFRKIGVRPWVSFRMNDVHGISGHVDNMLIKFWDEHPEYWRIRHHVPDGYFARTLDYELEAVRDEMFAYMSEALDRYDIDGVELDFTREMFSFKPGWEYKNRGIMTDYIRRIRKLCDEWEEKRGHRIMLGIKICAMPDQMYYQGFDYFTYGKEHLIDTLVVGARWETIDNDVPIEVWKQIMEPYGVQVAVTQELILRAHPTAPFYYLNTHETQLGSAAQYRSAGADFTYLYNHMRPTEVDYQDPKGSWTFAIYQEENYQMLMRNAGELETAIRAPRRHVSTFHDCLPEWEKQKVCMLPVHAEHNYTYPQSRIRCGKVPENSKVYLILAAKSTTKDHVDFEDFEIYLNSTLVKPVCEVDVRPYSKWQGYAFEVTDTSILDNVNTIEYACGKDAFDVDYTEIRVNASLEKTQWEKDTFKWQKWDEEEQDG